MFEQNYVVYPPNKPFHRPIEPSIIPVIYDFMLFIDFNDQGESIVGTSSLNGTLWEGTLLHFNNPESLKTLKYDKHYIGSTVSDGKFISENMIVLGEDTGIINILKVDGNTLKSQGCFKEADRISKVATWENSSRILTCSGNNVAVWDINNSSQEATEYFPNYHTQLINYVDTLKSDPNVFVSASTDRKCCIWDTRDSSPAQVLYANEFCTLTSAACHQSNANYVVVGTEAGDIYLLDRREPKEFISVASCNFKIHRIAFDNTNKLAICGDSNKILVFKCEDEILNSAYNNDKHSAFVRGLCWHNETLFSCGFDKQIVKHLF